MLKMKWFVIGVLLCFEAVSVFSKFTPEICPTIISKARWGGRTANRVEYTITPVPNVIIHHTDTPICTNEDECSARFVNIQSYHMDNLNFDDIGYNFMIGGDGQVYEGAGWHKVGAHAKGWNRNSIGIAFVGNFNTQTPTQSQLEAGKKFIQCGAELGELVPNYKLFGAKNVRATESPGKKLYSEIQNWKGFTRRP